jgi:hypothetical protein
MPTWQAAWRGGSFQCSQLTLLARGEQTPFDVHRTLSLRASVVDGDGDGDAAVSVKLRLLVGPVVFDADRCRMTLTEEVWRRAFRMHFKSLF